MTENRFDPAKDVANREKHKLPLAFGDRIFADNHHLIISSIRAINGEERFKVIGTVGAKLFTGVFVSCPESEIRWISESKWTRANSMG